MEGRQLTNGHVRHGCGVGVINGQLMEERRRSWKGRERELWQRKRPEGSEGGEIWRGRELVVMLRCFPHTT